MTNSNLENNAVDYLVIGAGPAGIAAARTLSDAGKQVTVFEQQLTHGGLCGSFDVNKCTFDKFAHLSFAPDELRNSMFNSVPLIEHSQTAANFYKDYWLKHPIITNLAPLPIKEKYKILSSFIKRPDLALDSTDYAEWSKSLYGEYFASEFIEKFTNKYWRVTSNRLDTSRIGNQIFKPTTREILSGMRTKNTKSRFYIGQLYYPSHNPKGQSGYVQILNKAIRGLLVFYNHKCIEIDPIAKTCTFNTGYKIQYNHLISTMPMPEMVMALTTCLAPYKYALCRQFKYTGGKLVSMVFNAPKVSDSLWYNVYDPEIPPARFYSPSLCCPENVTKPGEMSTLQGEVYFAQRGIPSPVSGINTERCIEDTIKALPRLGIDKTSLSDIAVRRENYANIIFDADTHKAVAEVQRMLNSYHIVNCGRFGLWRYLWSHQAYESGVSAAKRLLPQQRR